MAMEDTEPKSEIHATLARFSPVLRSTRSLAVGLTKKIDGTLRAARAFTRRNIPVLITRFRAQLPVVASQTRVHLQTVKTFLLRMYDSAARTLDLLRSKWRSALGCLWIACHVALVFADITGQWLGSRTTVLADLGAIYFERMSTLSVRLYRVGSDTLIDIFRTSNAALKRAWFHSSHKITLASHKTAILASQLSAASRPLAARLGAVERRLARLGTNSLKLLNRTFQRAKKEVSLARTQAHSTAVSAGAQLTRVGSHVAAWPKRLSGQLHTVQNGVTEVGRSFIEAPQRRKEARLNRENNLRTMLAGSGDAIVVTDAHRRLIHANRHALDLFGISELNLPHFTIDAFLPNDTALLDFHRDHAPVLALAGNPRRCKIRRLDGGIQSAECAVVPDVLPERHLFKFLNVAPYKISPPATHAGSGRPSAATSGAKMMGGDHRGNGPLTRRLPKHGVRPASH